MEIIIEGEKSEGVGRGMVKLDVAHWISRATFDVIGLAGKSTDTSLALPSFGINIALSRI